MLNEKNFFNNKEKISVSKEENKEELINPESPDFMAEDFKEAIYNRSLFGYMIADDKEKFLEENNLSDYEKSLVVDGKIPKMNLMIDIDGVLIDTEGELKKLAGIMTSDINIMKNTKEASEFIKKSKIPFSVLKVLLQARDQANEVHLVTDRMGRGPCHFPCLGKKKRQTLEDHNLNLKTNAFKMFSSGKEFVPMINEADITYYIGSSNSDRVYVDRIREAMVKDTIHNPTEENNSITKVENKINYLEIKPIGRTKNIL
jgi:2-hydroxy-3-keto-5-methylthiopentenyl-1-phosphate phosphatase